MDLVDFHNLYIVPLASNFLVNTETEEDRAPFCKLRVAAYEAMVDQVYNLA